jgi:hypothetical protein
MFFILSFFFYKIGGQGAEQGGEGWHQWEEECDRERE